MVGTPAGEELLPPGSMGHSKWRTDGQSDGIVVQFWRAMELEGRLVKVME